MALEQIMLGDRDRDLAGQFSGVWDGRVTTATAAELSFTVKAIDPKAEFGPAPYPRPYPHTHSNPEGGSTGAAAHAPANPARGTRCAVAFEEGDPDRPLVLALIGWPT